MLLLAEHLRRTRTIDPRRNPGHVEAKVLDRILTVTEQLKRRTMDSLVLKSGHRVLDVGCGPGTDTIQMAGFVGQTGLVLGIDSDPDMIKEANERAKLAGVAAWVRHEVADALCLPYKNNVFDACRSERLIQHLTDSRAALREMVRVIRPGGRLAVADADWNTLSIDSSDFELERRVVRGIAALVCNGSAGRQLYRLLKEEGLTKVMPEIHGIVWTDYDAFRAMSLSLTDFNQKLVDSGIISQLECRRFFTSLEDAAKRGAFLASGTLLLVIGEKSG